MQLEDTITAISTPPGEGGIGIIRISGPDAFKVANEVFKNKSINIPEINDRNIVYGHVVDPLTQQIIDEALLSKMSAPHTYTTEDTVEINCHGGAVALQKTLELTIKSGARLAQPGEFTQRAFVNGRIDLAQAEAVIDIIRSKSDSSLQIALNQLEGGLSGKIEVIRDNLLLIEANLETAIDFSDEDLETLDYQELIGLLEISIDLEIKLLESFDVGKALREGLRTVIVGRPNVGKSSTLNALLKEKRAIVTPIPGTTRDIIEEIINIGGIPLKVRDTAGLREPQDEIEKIGVELTEKSLFQADLVLLVVDSSEHLTDEDKKIIEMISEHKVIVVYNKIDLPSQADRAFINEHLPNKAIVEISATEGIGIDKLEKAIEGLVFSGKAYSLDEAIVSNVRHKDGINQAKEKTEEARMLLEKNIPEEIIAGVLREAIESLGTIIGRNFNQDLLDTIFSQFCLGK